MGFLSHQSRPTPSGRPRSTDLFTMTNPLHLPDPDNAPHDVMRDVAVEKIVRDGPSGAIAVAGTATLIVVAMVLLFYFFIYLPRGVVR